MEEFSHNRAIRPSQIFLIPKFSINQSIHARQCDHCLRPAPRLARHVDQPGGGGTDCCARCYRWLTCSLEPAPSPAQEAARSRWRLLFWGLCPWGLQPGGHARRIPISVSLPLAAMSTGTNTTIEQADPDPDSERLCECGWPLADNWSPHADRCETCRRYRPAPPPINPAPEAEPFATPLARLITSRCSRRTERRLCYAT